MADHPIEGIRIVDPLESVNLTQDAGPPPRPESSVAAVSGFNAAAKSAQDSPVVDPVTAEPEEAEGPTRAEVATRLTKENHETLAQMSEMLSGAHKLQAEQELTDLENLRKTIERNRHIHDALPPISVRDLLLSDYVSQKIPISDDYSMTFRTIATDVRFDSSEASAAYMDEWPKEAKAPGNLIFMRQVAALACGMTHLCGAPRYAMEIHSMKGRAERQTEIRLRMKGYLNLPAEVLQDMFAHQALFNARVRNAFGHSGWVTQEVGNS